MGNENNIVVRIEYIPEGDGDIDLNSSTFPSGNNINPSNMSILEIPHTGGRPFILGASPLGEGDVFWNTSNKYQGFIGETLSDEYGVFQQSQKIKIIGNNITFIMINFDSELQLFPIELLINETLYTNEGTTFLWYGSAINEIDIEIIKMNKPLYPLRITSILIDLIIDYDRTHLKRLVIGSQIIADNTMPSNGVIGQYGFIEFYDVDKGFLDLAQLKILKSDLSIKILFNEMLIGDFISEKWSYLYGNNIVSVTLQDIVNKWSEIVFIGIRNNDENTAYTFFNKLKDVTPQTININKSKELELKCINMPDGFIAAGNLLNAWNTFGEATLTKIYKRINGEVWAI